MERVERVSESELDSQFFQVVKGTSDRLASLFSVDGDRGGAKRHRKILRDNIQGITKPVCSSHTVP